MLGIAGIALSPLWRGIRSHVRFFRVVGIAGIGVISNSFPGAGSNPARGRPPPPAAASAVPAPLE